MFQCTATEASRAPENHPIAPVQGQQLELWNVHVHSILQIDCEVNQVKLHTRVAQFAARIGGITHKIVSALGVRIDNKAPSTGLIGLNRGALGLKFVARVLVIMHDQSCFCPQFPLQPARTSALPPNKHGFAPQIWICLSVSRLLLF